ncbi:MAG: hypothetical protein ACRC10_10835, partial [Thermoguttaceae bacterium]
KAELPDLPGDVVERLDEINRKPEQRVAPSFSSSTQTHWTPSSDNVRKRAIAYVANCPAAVSGEGGHNQTFAVASVLVWGFCLDDKTAFEILWNHYNPRCQPAWSEQELRHKIESARDNPPNKEVGWLLRETIEPVNNWSIELSWNPFGRMNKLWKTSINQPAMFHLS